MKRIILSIVFCLCMAFLPVVNTGCSTAPSQRSDTVTTLKIVGASVDASMKVAVQLLKNAQITREQWLRIADFHDRQFLPAYNLAVSAVQANIDSVADPALISLSLQLASIIASYQPSKSP